MASKGTLPQNLVGVVVAFVVSFFLGVWFTPFLVDKLGLATFSLIPLINQIVSYFSIFTNSVTNSIGRHITVSLEQEDIIKANQIFNSSIVSLTIINGIIFIPMMLLAWQAPVLFNVSEDIQSQARLLFMSAVVAFGLSSLSTPFSVVSFAKNKLYLNNSILTIANLSRVGTVVLLFLVTVPTLSDIACGLLLSSTFTLCASIIFWRKLLPVLKLSTKHFDLSIVRLLGRTSVWVAVTQVGTILLLSMDLVIVNYYLGAESGGYYALVLVWVGILRSMAVSLASIFAPSLISAYASLDISEVVVKAKQAIKFLGVFVALFVGGVVGFAEPLLNVWIGSEYSSHSNLMQLLVAPLCVNLAVLPLFSVLLGKDDVKLPGIITILTGAGNVLLALLLVKYSDLGVYGVAIASVTTLTLKNILFFPVYVSVRLKIGNYTFYKVLIEIIIYTSIVAISSYSLASWVAIDSWPSLLMAGVSIAIIYGALVYNVFLTDRDRDDFKHMLFKFFKKNDAPSTT